MANQLMSLCSMANRQMLKKLQALAFGALVWLSGSCALAAEFYVEFQLFPPTTETTP